MNRGSGTLSVAFESQRRRAYAEDVVPEARKDIARSRRVTKKKVGVEVESMRSRGDPDRVTPRTETMMIGPPRFASHERHKRTPAYIVLLLVLDMRQRAARCW